MQTGESGSHCDGFAAYFTNLKKRQALIPYTHIVHEYVYIALF